MSGSLSSLIGHAVILGLGYFAFPQARPFQVEEIDALPVDLVSIADDTDLLKGDKKSKIVPEEKAQPVPEVAAETPLPEPPKEEPKKAVEATPTPPPPPPPPPEPEVAALPDPLPEAAPEPKPEAPVDPRVPRHRPKPPPTVAKPKPQPTPQVAQQPEKPQPEFNPDDIAALLNKQEPAGGGDPTPAAEPQTIGSIEGHDQAAMTQSEIAALKARLYRCWNPPVAVREAASLVVTVRINLLADGSLAGPPQVLSTDYDPLYQIAAESAVRAVVQCAPFGDILRPEKYALWNQIDFIFDPREMLGG